MNLFLTILQLEFRRCKWLWIGTFAVLMLATGAIRLFSRQLPEQFHYLPYLLLYLSPLFFASFFPFLTGKGVMPFFRTLPIPSRQAYWSHYAGSLFSCGCFVLPPFLFFFHQDGMLWLSLFVLAHAAVFYGGVLQKDGGAALGLFLLFPLFLAWYPLMQLTAGGIHGLDYHNSNVINETMYYKIMPWAACFLAVIFLREGRTIWCAYRIFERNVWKRSILFLSVMFLFPLLCALLLAGAVLGLEYHWRSQLKKVSGFITEETIVPVRYPGAKDWTKYLSKDRNERIAFYRDLQIGNYPPEQGRFPIRNSYSPSTSTLPIFDYRHILFFKDLILEKKWRDAETVLDGIFLLYGNMSPQELIFERKYQFFTHMGYRLQHAENTPELLPVLNKFIAWIDSLTLPKRECYLLPPLFETSLSSAHLQEPLPGYWMVYKIRNLRSYRDLEKNYPRYDYLTFPRTDSEINAVYKDKPKRNYYYDDTPLSEMIRSYYFLKFYIRPILQAKRELVKTGGIPEQITPFATIQTLPTRGKYLWVEGDHEELITFEPMQEKQK